MQTSSFLKIIALSLSISFIIYNILPKYWFLSKFYYFVWCYYLILDQKIRVMYAKQ